MTRLEVMKVNKANYDKALTEIATLPAGLTKDVKQHLILTWIKGTNWMGGISDKKFSQIANTLPYTFEEIYDEFNKQMMSY